MKILYGNSVFVPQNIDVFGKMGQCKGTTCTGRRCKKKTNAEFCFMHKPKFVMIPSGLPPRRVNNVDLFVFERVVVELANSPKDVANLCLASKKFLRHFRKPKVQHTFVSKSCEIANFPIEKYTEEVFIKYLGFQKCRRKQRPMKMYQHLQRMRKPRKPEYVDFKTRSGLIKNISTYGLDMMVRDIYFGQRFHFNLQWKEKTFTDGIIIGVEKDAGATWIQFDGDKGISTWSMQKTKQELIEMGVIFDD